MSVKRYALEHERGESNTFGCPDGDYVLFKDYAALEARCAKMEEALIVISRLPYCDRHLSKDLARVALADTTTDEVQP